MSLQIVYSILALILLVVIALSVYVVRTGSKTSNKVVPFYQELQERFGLEPLTVGKGSVDRNTELIQRQVKLIWDKKDLEEIDVKPSLQGLTQGDALHFVELAEELYFPKGEKGFIYDVRDAKELNLHLYAVVKDQPTYTNFLLGQALIKLLKSKARLEEFPELEFGDARLETDLSNLDSFIVASKGIVFTANLLGPAVETLEEKFGGEWEVYKITEDALKFTRKEPEPEPEPEPLESPFALQKQAKAKAEAEEKARQEALERDRRQKWLQAEAERKRQEAAKLAKAVAAGEVTPLVLKPLAFLAQVVEVASDASGLLTMEEKVAVKKSDRIGVPVDFMIISSETLQQGSSEVEAFSASVIEQLQKNFGGNWGVNFDTYSSRYLNFYKILQ